MPYSIDRMTQDGPVTIVLLTSPRIGKYTLRNPNGTELPDSAGKSIAIKPLGAGTYGLVIRATDSLGLDRAVKVIDPNELPQDYNATDVFKQEIVLTGAFPLKHTIPIVDFDYAEDSKGTPFGYYVMPYVPGVTVERFIGDLLASHGQAAVRNPMSRQILRDVFLRLVHQLVLGIEELHQHRVVHMDISASNVMVCAPELAALAHLQDLPMQTRAFLIDLGAAKKMTEQKTGLTIFIHHKYFFPNELKTPEHLNPHFAPGKQYQQISYERLAKYWRQIDLHCLGRLLEMILLNRVDRATPNFSYGEDEARRELTKAETWKAILGDDYRFLERVIDRILNVWNPVYPDASSLREVIETLRATSAVSTYDSVPLTDKYPGVRIRAGRYLVKIAPPLHLAVDHPAFQRLRQLKQLTLLDEVFPGAGHNRFAHSLQTFNLMKQYLFALSGVTDFKLEFGRRDVDDTLAASLLHDIGQYPYSHAIEDLRKLGDESARGLKEDLPRSNGLQGSLESELAKLKPLQDVKYDQELARDYLNVGGPDGDKGPSIAGMLTEHGFDVERILYLMSKDRRQRNRRPADNIGRDLVAGVIDSDRVSYLRYDSEQTGVRFGLAVDIESLLEGLTVRCDEAAGVGVEEGAVPAVEALLASVYWMYRNVYWHHTNRAMMAAVKHVVSRLLRSGAMSFSDYQHACGWSSDREALRFLKVTYDQLVAEEALAGGAANPLAKLVGLRRIGYKRVCSIGLTLAEAGTRDRGAESPEGATYRRLVEGLTPDRELELLEALGREATAGTSARDGEILVDVPLKPRLRWAHARRMRDDFTESHASESEATVWVRRRKLGTKRASGWVSLQEYSPICATLAAMEDVAGRKVRVFVCEELLNRLSEHERGELELRMKEVVAAQTGGWGDRPPAQES